MKPSHLLLSLFCVAPIAFVFSCTRPAEKSLVITNVTVIDMTGAEPRAGQTVLVVGERIAAVGAPSAVPVPGDARVVEGTRKFLIPGLADMHVHLTAAGEPDGSRKFIVPLLIANGITSVRDMGGYSESLTSLRKEIKEGKRLGPQFLFSGPYLDGDEPSFLPSIVVKAPEDAKKAIDDAIAKSVDFIKTQSGLSREAYLAIAAQSKAKHIPFVGHVPDRVSALEASNAGQASIEHLTGVLLACSEKEAELRREQFVSDPPNGSPEQSSARRRAWQQRLLDSYSPQKADKLIQAFRDNDTWQVPTFPVLVHLAFMTPQTNLATDPLMQYVPQNESKIWQQGIQGQLEHSSIADFALRKEIMKRSLEIVGKMQAAGVHIMAGTDMPAPNIFPGFSLHQDLDYLVEAGLTPMQALQGATRSPAEFLGRSEDSGTIAAGQYADLVLLDANPLDDIHHTRQIRAVVLRGRLLDRAALDALLAEERRFAASH